MYISNIFKPLIVLIVIIKQSLSIVTILYENSNCFAYAIVKGNLSLLYDYLLLLIYITFVNCVKLARWILFNVPLIKLKKYLYFYGEYQP